MTILVIPVIMLLFGVETWTTVGIVLTIVALEITIVAEWDKIVAFWQKYYSPSVQTHPIAKVELELPEGRMRLDSPFYVERPPIEAECYAQILTPCGLISIKAPRQMGKTSLLSRILHHAQSNGARTVEISFQETETDTFAKLETYLKWFCHTVTQKLDIVPQVNEYWSSDFSQMQNTTNYFQQYLLPQVTEPLVLGLDEVDRIFSYERVAKNVLPQWRNWHERGKDTLSPWARVRLIIVHSQEVYVPLNINESPFNVGLPIQLPELTLAQVSDLAQRHGLAWTEYTLTQLMQMVGGHPWLVRQAFYQIASGYLTLEQLLKTAPSEEGIYSAHLRHHLLLLQEAGLDQVMKQVVQSQNSVFIDTNQAFKLHGMGLVKRQEHNVIPAFDLYRRYFQQRL